MSFCTELEKAAEVLERSEAVVVGAGSGLSASAGLTYDGPRFQEHFADFIARYHVTDMYSAGFYPYPTGAAISGGTAMPRAGERSTAACWSWWEKGITLSLPPTWTTASSGRALTKSGSFTPREITGCFNAPSPATVRPTTTGRPWRGW